MIREEFPPLGSTYEGGISDGWQYQIKFAGSNLQASLDMVKTFLAEEGYANVPTPQYAEELLHFKFPSKRGQILLFDDNGYIHNPIKILFDPSDKLAKKLTLCIFNEKYDNYLLRFHGKIKNTL
jgi:hypothetical protein